MGSITEISQGSQIYQVVPVGGTTSNGQGTFTYNGVNYRMYTLLVATANSSFDVQVRTCQ
jgi:hypothetical protein